MYNILTYNGKEFTHSGRTILRVLQTIDPNNIMTSGLVLDLNPAKKVYSDNGITPCVDGGLIYKWCDCSPTQTDMFQTVFSDRPTWFASGTTPYVFMGSFETLISQKINTLTDADLSFYVISKSTGSHTEYDSILTKSTDSNWSDGWTLYTNSAGDFNSCVTHWSTYDINNLNGQNNIKEIKSYRFKRSAGTQYINNRVNTNTFKSALSTTTNSNTPNIEVILNGTWSIGTQPKETTLTNKQYVWRVLVYSGYHDDATQLQLINQLNTIYHVF